MSERDLIRRHKSEIDTPALLLSMDAVERNIAKMAESVVKILARGAIQ